MQRPPRSPRAHLLSSALIQWGLLQGMVALAVVAAIYLAGCGLGMAAADIRTLTFIALVCGNLTLVLVNRSFSAGGLRLLRGTSRVFYAISAAVAGLLATAVLWTPARRVFQFGTFHGHDLLFVLASVAALMLALEGAKIVWPDRFQAVLAR